MSKEVKIVSRPTKFNVGTLIVASATGGISLLAERGSYLVEYKDGTRAEVYAQNDDELGQKIAKGDIKKL
jgi:hypothetical protein